MLVFASPLFNGSSGAAPPASGPIDPATVFQAGASGDYWDFTDAVTLAVNADGTGGVPAIDGACRWASGKRGIINLRNTVSSCTRRSNGIETTGVNYGLFCLSGFGWPGNIPQPYEIMFAFEQLAYAGNDTRIFCSGGASHQVLQGPASGSIRQFLTNYGASHSLPLNTEAVFDGLANGTNSASALNNGAMIDGGESGTFALQGIALGSADGGSSATRVRFKRMLVIGRALTSAERSGLTQWMIA